MTRDPNDKTSMFFIMLVDNPRTNELLKKISNIALRNAPEKGEDRLGTKEKAHRAEMEVMALVRETNPEEFIKMEGEIRGMETAYRILNSFTNVMAREILLVELQKLVDR